MWFHSREPGNAQDLPPGKLLNPSRWKENHKPEEGYSAQQWGFHLYSGHQASKCLPGSACIFYPVVTVRIVMPSAAPSKNQQDTSQLVPSLSGPVSSSLSPSSVTASAMVTRWHCGSCRNLGDMGNKIHVPIHVGMRGRGSS